MTYDQATITTDSVLKDYTTYDIWPHNNYHILHNILFGEYLWSNYL